MPLRNRSIWNKEGNVYFVTTTVVNFEKIFSLSSSYPSVLVKSLKFLIKEHRAVLFAYVIMPSHIHIIIYLPKGESISDFMRDFKKFTSTKVRVMMENDGHFELIDRLRHIIPAGSKQSFKLWENRFDDLLIYTDKIMRIKVNYIHNNPVKAGLVKEDIKWKYSSARNYFLGDNSIIEIATDWGVEQL